MSAFRNRTPVVGEIAAGGNYSPVSEKADQLAGPTRHCDG